MPPRPCHRFFHLLKSNKVIYVQRSQVQTTIWCKICQVDFPHSGLSSREARFLTRPPWERHVVLLTDCSRSRVIRAFVFRTIPQSHLLRRDDGGLFENNEAAWFIILIRQSETLEKAQLHSIAKQFFCLDGSCSLQVLFRGSIGVEVHDNNQTNTWVIPNCILGVWAMALKKEMCRLT